MALWQRENAGNTLTLFALATLADATQIESICVILPKVARASKDIQRRQLYHPAIIPKTFPMYMSLKE